MAKQINVAMKKILFVLFALFPLLINAQETSDKEYTGVIYNLPQLDNPPLYPGGIEKLYAFVNKCFKIPIIKEDGVYTIEISFVVEADGMMSSFKIVTNPGHGLGEEGLRAVKSIKEIWEPGILNGERVRTSCKLPIKITIKST
jgi:protein TonB